MHTYVTSLDVEIVDPSESIRKQGVAGILRATSILRDAKAIDIPDGKRHATVRLNTAQRDALTDAIASGTLTVDQDAGTVTFTLPESNGQGRPPKAGTSLLAMLAANAADDDTDDDNDDTDDTGTSDPSESVKAENAERNASRRKRNAENLPQ